MLTYALEDFIILTTGRKNSQKHFSPTYNIIFLYDFIKSEMTEFASLVV